jgi:hypothetical protein
MAFAEARNLLWEGALAPTLFAQIAAQRMQPEPATRE